MNLNIKTKIRLRRWGAVGVLTVLIYSTLGVVRAFSEFLESILPFELTMAVVLWGSIALALYQSRRWVQWSLWRVAGLVMILSAYAVSIEMLPIVNERIHLLEYGLLAFLVYHACRIDFYQPWAYLIAFIITALIGWGDEGIQYLLPDRYYQFRDVLINAGSAVLGLALCALLYPSRKSSS